MTPASFAESTHVMGRPADMTDEQCGPLSVAIGDCDDHPVVVSCWKLTTEELAEFQRTGRIWLIIHSLQMPPVTLTANNPFTAGN